MSGAGGIPWREPPFSALCLLRWGAGATASGWLQSPNRLITAGHVIADIGPNPVAIFSAFGPLQPQASHNIHYMRTPLRPPQGSADDFGVIEVSGVPPSSFFLRMVVPSRVWRGPVFLLAFDSDGQPQFNSGSVAQYSDVRFLHTCDAWPGYSGGAIIVRAPQIGTAAIGIHTDLGRPYTELVNDPGGLLAPPGPQYQVATSLSIPVQQLLMGANA